GLRPAPPRRRTSPCREPQIPPPEGLPCSSRESCPTGRLHPHGARPGSNGQVAATQIARPERRLVAGLIGNRAARVARLLLGEQPRSLSHSNPPRVGRRVVLPRTRTRYRMW